MQRYLLFDSACNLCAQIAEDVIRESEGRLEARSLREPAIREMLNKAQPNWQWEPMVVEIEAERVRVFTRARIGFYLAQKLGIRPAWRIARLVQQAGVPIFSISHQRRLVLKGTGGLLGGLALLGSRFNRSKAQDAVAQGETSNRIFLPLVQSSVETAQAAAVSGELYGGFVLLPDGAPLPPFVKDYKYGIPTMCGVGEAHGVQSDAKYIILDSMNTLVAETKMPAYMLVGLDNITQLSNISIVKHGTGELWGSWVTYGSEHPEFKQQYTSIAILAQYDFPQPMPLWSSTPLEKSGPSVLLEKIEFLPDMLGVLIRTPVGFALHWIEQSVYYMLSVDHLPVDVTRVAAALTKTVP